MSKSRSGCYRDECTNVARRYGLCAKHYREMCSAGNPACTAPGCEKPRYSSGLCWNHLQAEYRRDKKARAMPMVVKDWPSSRGAFVAKYVGVCTICHTSFKAGEYVHGTSPRHYAHFECWEGENPSKYLPEVRDLPVPQSGEQYESATAQSWINTHGRAS